MNVLNNNGNKYVSQGAIKRQNDRIYYNIRIGHQPGTGASPAIYREELTQSIVENPSDYYLSIIRFTIPTQEIPIFQADIQPFPNTNLNNTVYSVTLNYGANTSGQIFIQYTSTTAHAEQSRPLTLNHPNVDKTAYYYIYTYTEFLLQINTALAAAFAALPGKPGGALAPYFIYDENIEKISLVAQRLYYDVALGVGNYIEIYSNLQLFNFLDGIPTFYFGDNQINGEDNQYLIRDKRNNYYQPPDVAVVTPPAYFIMTQEYNTLPNWNSFKSLVLVSNLLPIIQEYVPRVSGQNQGVVNSQGILKDFEPLIELGPEARTSVQYQINGPYQLINLNSDSPLTKIDISIYWVNKLGDQYLLLIPYDQVVTLKMVFIKKSTFEGY